jgi:TPP-dependent trihydroxycyclohexane-1,2-dione (THcHDO) dehydratase
MRGLSEALHSLEGEPAVMREVVLSSVIPKHLCSCLALALQHLSAAPAGSVGPEAPSLAAAANLAHLARLPLPGAGDSVVCRGKLATVVHDSGERCCCCITPGP